MKQCTRCKIEKNDNQFSLQIQRNGSHRLSSWCKKCNSIVASANNRNKRKQNPKLWRQKDKERWEIKRLTELPKRKIIAAEKKQKYVAYMGGKCKLCGYNKCMASLDFHHIDPKQKDF